MYIYLSILAFALLFAPAEPIKIGILIILFLSLYIFRVHNKKTQSCVFTKGAKTLSFCTLIFLSTLFINKWSTSSKAISIANSIGISKYILLSITAIILSVLSYKCLLLITHTVCSAIPQAKTNSNYKYTSLWLFIFATILITIFSYCSPLYPFQTWVDPNCFFTVGKSILDGIVPYRDLYEQKGPLLYFMHTFASLISYRTFIGVYLLEIIAAWAFLSISYKLINLFNKNKHSLFITIICGIVIYSSPCFVSGDSAEEFCLPLIAYTLYIGLKTIINKSAITPLQAFCIGITASCVLWIKFSITGFYFGWIIYLIYFYIKNKWAYKILSSFLYAFLGLAISSIPIITYFIYNNALYVMLETYFYNNSTMYWSSDSIIINLYNNLSTSFNFNVLIWTFIILGQIITLRQKCASYFLITLCSTFAFCCCNVILRPYYSLILAIFVPLGTTSLNYLKVKWPNIIPYTLIVTCIFANTLYSLKSSSIFESEKDLPQYKFDKHFNAEENPTLLNYGFLDGGFYTYSGILPSNKFFCQLNIKHPDMMKDQDSIADNGLTKFIITRRYKGATEKKGFNRYAKIAECQDYNHKEKLHLIYTLYKRKENVNIK